MRKWIIFFVFLCLFVNINFVGAEFVDMPDPEHWAAESLAKIHELGLVIGYPDGEYKGDRPLSRYELALVAARIWEKINAKIASIQIDNTQFQEMVKEELALIRAHQAGFKDELAQIKAQLELIQAKNLALARQVEALTSDDAERGASLEENIARELATLKADLETLSAQIAKYNQDLLGLQPQQVIIKEEADLGEISAEISQLKEKVAFLEQKQAALEAGISEKVQTQAQELAVLKEKIALLESNREVVEAIAANTKEIGLLKAQVAALERELFALQNDQTVAEIKRLLDAQFPIINQRLAAQEKELAKIQLEQAAMRDQLARFAIGLGVDFIVNNMIVHEGTAVLAPDDLIGNVLMPKTATQVAGNENKTELGVQGSLRVKPQEDTLLHAEMLAYLLTTNPHGLSRAIRLTGLAEFPHARLEAQFKTVPIGFSQSVAERIYGGQDNPEGPRKRPGHRDARIVFTLSPFRYEVHNQYWAGGNYDLAWIWGGNWLIPGLGVKLVGSYKMQESKSRFSAAQAKEILRLEGLKTFPVWGQVLDLGAGYAQQVQELEGRRRKAYARAGLKLSPSNNLNVRFVNEILLHTENWEADLCPYTWGLQGTDLGRELQKNWHEDQDWFKLGSEVTYKLGAGFTAFGGYKVAFNVKDARGGGPLKPNLQYIGEFLKTLFSSAPGAVDYNLGFTYTQELAMLGTNPTKLSVDYLYAGKHDLLKKVMVGSLKQIALGVEQQILPRHNFFGKVQLTQGSPYLTLNNSKDLQWFLGYHTVLTGVNVEVNYENVYNNGGFSLDGAAFAPDQNKPSRYGQFNLRASYSF